MSKTSTKALQEQLKDSIVKAVVRADEAGQASEEEKSSVYFANAPEGINKEVVSAVEEYNSNFIVAANMATFEIGSSVLKENENLNSYGMNLGVGTRGSVQVDLLRKQEGRNPRTGETVASYGVLKTTVDTQGTIPGLKALRDNMKKVGAELLGE